MEDASLVMEPLAAMTPMPTEPVCAEPVKLVKVVEMELPFTLMFRTESVGVPSMPLSIPSFGFTPMMASCSREKPLPLAVLTLVASD